MECNNNFERMNATRLLTPILKSASKIELLFKNFEAPGAFYHHFIILPVTHPLTFTAALLPEIPWGVTGGNPF